MKIVLLLLENNNNALYNNGSFCKKLTVSNTGLRFAHNQEAELSIKKHSSIKCKSYFDFPTALSPRHITFIL